ncbi:MAG: ATP synthase F1 subunit gamma [Chloroflexota bacterium]
MATTRAIQRRIKSVRNISQVTRAMQMVAASKMRRAQQATLASRAYAAKAREILTYLAAQPGRNKTLHPLLEMRSEIKNTLLILITSDRGLCGAYNMNILRATLDFIKRQEKPVKLVTLGKRGRDFIVRSGKNIIAEFTGFSEKPTVLNIGPIAKIAIEEFESGQVDRVDIAFTDFVNVLVQRPQIQQLLPLEQPAEPISGAHAVYLYEPDPESILATLLPRLTELQIYQALLESVASEFSAQMVAMRNATDNALELIDSYTLEMNKARQATITKEMLDIVGGANALRETLAK